MTKKTKQFIVFFSVAFVVLLLVVAKFFVPVNFDKTKAPLGNADNTSTVKTYEFLVKVEDELTSKKGDCVAFKETGWGWGTSERKHYAILKVKNTTYEQAQEWCSVETATTSVYTIEGKPEIYQAKKYSFDIDSMPQKSDWLDQEKEVLPVVFDKNKIQLKK